ncbi:MAG: CRISPR-associated endonuclease Cas1 [Candidatus Syntropharchaeia archaeon]
MMDLVIDKHGTFIGKKQGRIVIYGEGGKEEYAVSNIDRILIFSGCGVSSSALTLLINSKKDIVFLNKFGTPVAKVFYISNDNFPLLRKMQYRKSLEDNTELIRGLVKSSVNNKIEIIKKLAYSRKRTNSCVSDMLFERIEELKKLLSLAEAKSEADELRGVEGMSSRIYFGCLRAIIPKRFSFRGRERPPPDVVNASLSYGYGILFSEVWNKLVAKGFDPYIGFYHVEKGRKPCLVLDFMEEFRQPVVDASILKLIFKKILDPEKHGNPYLNEKGRKIVIEEVLSRIRKYEGLMKRRIDVWTDYILERSNFIPFGEKPC